MIMRPQLEKHVVVDRLEFIRDKSNASHDQRALATYS